MPRVLAGVVETLDRLADRCEVVLVDDGSTDGTRAAAQAAMGKAAENLRVVTHKRKSGYGITVADGLRAARGDWVAFMDGDGQFDPRDLSLLAAESANAE